jgi:glycosyltransferase involved in cell wall biosynthesis
MEFGISDLHLMYFSILIPLYNKSEYISNTLNSVLGQTYSKFEVIIIDDGSTDGSDAIVSKYTDPRIRILRQENKGVSAARNYGIKKAKYKLIALLDGDDLWDKRYLEEIVILIGKYPEISIYGTQLAGICNGRIISRPFILNNFEVYGKFDLFEIITKNKGFLHPISSSSVVFRKNILEKAGNFDERITHGEDYDFFFRISLYSEIAFVEKELAYWNQSVLASKRASGHLPDIKNHIVYYVDKFKPYFQANENLKTVIYKLILKDLRYHYKNKEYAKLKKQILKDIPISQYTIKHILIYYTPIYRLFKSYFQRLIIRNK